MGGSSWSPTHPPAPSPPVVIPQAGPPRPPLRLAGRGSTAYLHPRPAFVPAAIRREGGAMPTVFGYHDVKDKDHWLASPRREEFFGPLGVTNIRTFVDPQNPTRVAVLMDVPDLDALMAAMQTAAAARAVA